MHGAARDVLWVCGSVGQSQGVCVCVWFSVRARVQSASFLADYPYAALNRRGKARQRGTVREREGEGGRSGG
eukprot:512337-Rhodomonas_salina.1